MSTIASICGEILNISKIISTHPSFYLKNEISSFEWSTYNESECGHFVEDLKADMWILSIDKITDINYCVLFEL